MLFAYTFVPHTMEKMQSYIEFIFFEVWCQAPWKKYDISLFDGNPELREIIVSLHNTEPKGAEFFIEGIQKVFKEFRALNICDIDRMKKWYLANNCICDICQNSDFVFPIRYHNLESCFRGRYKTVCNELKGFFKNLYSDNFLSLKIVADKVGTVESHYSEFAKINNQGKCPFCGIHDLKGTYHSKREAYDHYLPKAKYPFNSINFRNLAPACHECNSSYKQSKDPLYVPKDPLKKPNGGRRKSFYPFQADAYQIEFKIKIDTQDWNNIQPDELSLHLGPEQLHEEIETWLDVYGIEERYKAKCCGNNDGKGWILSVLDEWKEDGRSPEDYLNTLARQAKIRPYIDENFLKQPFLDACQIAGLFDGF